MRIGILTKGKGYLGPEWYGCCGTGRRPLILRCQYTGRYVVGPELYVEQFRRQIIKYPKRRIFRDGKVEVFSFKSRTPAVRKFHAMCEEIRTWNAQQAAEHKAAIKGAKRGDAASILKLGDF